MLAVPPAGLGWADAVNNSTLSAKAQGTYLQNSAATAQQQDVSTAKKGGPSAPGVSMDMRWHAVTTLAFKHGH
jgi:hypothetical protein